MIGSSKELMLSNGSQAKLFEQLAHSKQLHRMSNEEALEARFPFHAANVGPITV